MKTATCTWGDGPDVLLSLEDDNFMLYEDPKHNKPPQGDPAHGYVTKGSSCLTADEALSLSIELRIAANEAKALNELCKDADEAEAKKMPNVPKYVGDPLSEKDLMEILADHPLETLTCYKCNQRDTCKYVDDLYNIDGDCLAMK
jgi:hypothetical protein